MRKLAMTMALGAVLGGVWAVVVHSPPLMACAVLLFLLAGWLASRTLERQLPAAYSGIEIDQDGVGNAEHKLRWSELTRIQIITTDQGPFADDLFWIFEGSAAAAPCIIPGPAIDGRLFEYLEQLPGVDYDQIIRAQGSCDNAQFLIWTAPACQLTA